MAESKSVLKTTLISVGALAVGAYLWYMSRDYEDALDYTQYTEEKLKEFMLDIELEVSCIYVRNHARIKQAKEEGEWKDGDMENMEKLLQIEIRERTEEMVQKYCLKSYPNEYPEDADYEKQGIESYEQFQMWVEHFKNSDFIREQDEKF